MANIIKFKDFERMLLRAGFELKRQKGSHRTYRHPSVPGLLTVQPNGKDAEPYQVRKLFAMLEEYNLPSED